MITIIIRGVDLITHMRHDMITQILQNNLFLLLGTLVTFLHVEYWKSRPNPQQSWPQFLISDFVQLKNSYYCNKIPIVNTDVS